MSAWVISYNTDTIQVFNMIDANECPSEKLNVA